MKRAVEDEGTAVYTAPPDVVEIHDVKCVDVRESSCSQ